MKHECKSMTMSPALSLAGLATLLALAVVSDLRSRRIPNELVLTGLLLALGQHAAMLLAGQAPLAGAHAWSPLAGALAGGAALLPLYLLRASGAGDVKLMATVGAFVGAAAALTAALYTLLAGGVLALLWMLGHAVATRTLDKLRWRVTGWLLRLQGVPVPLALHDGARGLPYAVAIAAGTVAALLWPLRP